MVYDGTDMRIYINGELDPSAPVAKTDTLDSSSRAVHLGRRERDSYNGVVDQRAFLGLIDEAQIYARALTAAEVEALHDEFVPPEADPGLFFSDITVSAGVDTLANGGRGVSFAQVTNDNLPDYYQSNAFEGSSNRSDQFYRNVNGATFAEEASASGIADTDGGSHSGIWADLDNDGDYDLVNGSTWSNADPTPGNPASNSVYENTNGNGSFNENTDPDIAATLVETRGVVAFDMDADGDLDLFGAGGFESPGVKEAYQNDGGFAFTPHGGGDLTSASVPTMWGVTDTDYDGDGDIDIITANLGRTAPFDTEFAILDNDGSGNFTRVLPSTIGIVTGGGNSDDRGKRHHDRRHRQRRRPGHVARFTRPKAPSGDRMASMVALSYTLIQDSFGGTDGNMAAFADLDNDGFDQDLVFAGEENVWLNNGSGRYVQAGDQSVPINGIDVRPRSIAFADIDNDGDLDFAISSRDTTSRLIRNDWDDADNNWLKVQLIAANGQAGARSAPRSSSTKPGPGRSVLLGTARSPQQPRATCRRSDPVLHFGLGSETTVDIVVDYVGGSSTTCVNVQDECTETNRRNGRQPV